MVKLIPLRNWNEPDSISNPRFIEAETLGCGCVSPRVPSPVLPTIVNNPQ